MIGRLRNHSVGFSSIGFASRDAGRQTVTDLLQAADEAMYWVKAHGKNGIHGS